MKLRDCLKGAKGLSASMKRAILDNVEERVELDDASELQASKDVVREFLDAATQSRDAISEALKPSSQLEPEPIPEVVAEVPATEPDQISPKEAKPRKKKSDTDKVNELAIEIAGRTRRHFENLSKPPETRLRGTRPDYEGFMPELFEYETQTNANSIRQAQELVDQVGGPLKAAEILKDDPLGKKFEITDPEGVDMLGQDGILHAIYELVGGQFAMMEKEMEGDHSFTAGQKSIPRKARLELEKTAAKLGTEAGQWSQFTNRLFKTWNGIIAKSKYVEPTLAHLNKVLGKKAAGLVEDLSEEINKLIGQYVNGQVDKAWMLAFVRNFYKSARTRSFQQEQRKVIAKNDKAIRKIVRRGGKRAAEYIALDEEGTERLESIKNSIVKLLGAGGRPTTGPKSYEQIFNSVVRKVAEDAAERVGLVNEKQTLKKASIEDQFKAILLNDTLYAQFVDDLYTAYVQEHGGKNPSADFMGEANQFYNELANRAWTESMVDSLMSKKMREFEMKFAKIAAQSYKDGELNREYLSLAIKSELEEAGVTNDELLEQLVNDIEEDFEDSLQAAREKFFGSPKGIRDNLESIQNFLGMVPKKMAEIAVEHSSAANEISDSLEDYLKNEYAMPEVQANHFARLLQRELSKGLHGPEGAIEKSIQRWVKQATRNSTPKVKRQAEQAIDKIIKLSNTGVMRREDVYNKLAKEFGLPKYDPEVAKQLEQLGDRIGLVENDRMRDTIKQEMINLIHSKVGVSASDVYTAWFYISMLSGPSTQAVNILGNAMSVGGQVLVEASKNPRKGIRMLAALFKAAAGVSQLEAREAFFTAGDVLGKEDQKYFRGTNAMEMMDPEITSDWSNSGLPDVLVTRLEAINKFTAGIVQKVGRKARFVTRALQAADIFFYKAAQEMKYVGETGDYATPEMYAAAETQARREMLADGQDPDANRASHRRMQVIARNILEQRRLDTEDKKRAWEEASVLATNATFQQKPKGILGAIAGLIEKLTKDYPLAKLIVPFTRVAANVTNHMLEWTPWGAARWAFSKSFMKEYQDEFGSHFKRDQDILNRAIIGTATMMLLMWRMAYEDAEDPEFTIYADGPRDPNKRRQLMDRGWKPHTVKFGNSYYSYLYTPLSIGLAVLGKHMDRFRDGEIGDPISGISLSSSAAAVLKEITNQSFLMGLTNLMSAVDSSNPEKNLSQLFARTTTTPFVPNIARQIANYVDPTVSQAEGFWQNFVKEIPIARSSLKPMLNTFGEPVRRFRGIFPGIERFVTTERTDDPIYNLIGEKKLTIPGFSKNTHIGDRNINEGEYYEYVQKAGQMIKRQMSAELMRLKAMDREQAQKRVEKIAEEAKDKVRRDLRAKAPK